VSRPTSIRAIAYAHSTNPAADGATPRNTADPMAAAPACAPVPHSALTRDPVHGKMNRVPAHIA
jgi:hypothetical protein